MRCGYHTINVIKMSPMMKGANRDIFLSSNIFLSQKLKLIQSSGTAGR